MPAKDVEIIATKGAQPTRYKRRNADMSTDQISSTSLGIQRWLDEKPNETPWTALKQGQRYSSNEPVADEEDLGKV